MKKALKVILIVFSVIVLALTALLGWLTATEFMPEPVEELEIQGVGGWYSPKLGE